MSGTYVEAGKVLGMALRDKVGIRSLLYREDDGQGGLNRKKVFALVCKTLKDKDRLLQIAKRVPECGIERERNLERKWMRIVMLWDLLFGARKIQGGGRVKKQMMEYCAQFQEILKEKGWNSDENREKVPVNGRPLRFARVNTLKCSMDDIHAHFKQSGFNQVENEGAHFSPEENTYYVDRDISDLLVFSPNVDLHDDPFVTQGKLILQDKASCFTAAVLNPPPNVHVLDACASPGNKTTHIAAIMNSQGVVDAFERDQTRFQHLVKNVQLCVPLREMVRPHHQDFLAISSSDPLYQDVWGVIVDPTCSGSGLNMHRPESLLHSEKSGRTARTKAEALSKFQERILEHALRFPRVHKVVYSTCSIFEEENEEVVRRVLSKAEFSDSFEIENALPQWPQRGISKGKYPFASNCIRCFPNTHRMHGFFVASFVRKAVSNQEIESDEQKLFKEANQSIAPSEKKRCSPEASDKIQTSKKRRKKNKIFMKLK